MVSRTTHMHQTQGEELQGEVLVEGGVWEAAEVEGEQVDWEEEEGMG